VTEEDEKRGKERLAQLSPDFKADILHAHEIAKDCREIFIRSEEVRGGGGEARRAASQGEGAKRRPKQASNRDE
jgi:hypothetical protein